MNRKTISAWTLGVIGCGMLATVWLTPHRSAHAAVTTLYVMNSGGLTSSVYAVNPSTMAVTQTYALPVGNGRGIAVVGGTMYYTRSNSANIYSYNLGTSTDNGVLFTITGQGVVGLDSIAYDGANLWVADLGSKRAFQLTTSGTLVNTLTLATTTAGYSGLEFFRQAGAGRLIANEGNVNNVFDIYDTSANVVTPHFINPGGTSTYTGLAYTGTNFVVSNNGTTSLDTFSGTTGSFIQSQALTGFSGLPSLWDVSADYNQTLPTESVPALGTWGLVLCGVLLLATGLLMGRKPVQA
jgi:hypothetical protein